MTLSKLLTCKRWARRGTGLERIFYTVKLQFCQVYRYNFEEKGLHHVIGSKNGTMSVKKVVYDQVYCASEVIKSRFVINELEFEIFCKILPNIEFFRWKRLFLVCRPVCINWRRSLDGQNFLCTLVDGCYMRNLDGLSLRNFWVRPWQDKCSECSDENMKYECTLKLVKSQSGHAENPFADH